MNVVTFQRLEYGTFSTSSFGDVDPMKKTNLLQMAAILLGINLVFCTGKSLAAENFTEVAIPVYPPYFNADTSADIGGLAELIAAVFERADITVKFKVMPYVRKIREVEEGRLHVAGIVNAQTSQRMRLSAEHTLVLEQTFFVRQDNPWFYDGIESLDALKVATVNSYDYSPISPSYQSYLDTSSNVVSISPNETYLVRIAKMIEVGRVDVFNEDRVSMNYAIKQAGLEGLLKEAGTLPVKLKEYLGFSPTQTGDELREKFDNAFREMLVDGEIEDILARWNMRR